MPDQPRCHCEDEAVIRYRLLPRPDRAPISEAGRRAQGRVYDEHACLNVNHQREARDAGTVLAVEPLGTVATRVVPG